MREDSGIMAFARSYTAAWCSQDPMQVAGHYEADGSLSINGGEASVGRTSIADAARSFMTAFPDLEVLLDNVEESASGIIYRWTLVGTNLGPGGSRRSVRISGYEEWTLGRGGLIAESLGHFDAAEYQRQIEGDAPSSPRLS